MIKLLTTLLAFTTSSLFAATPVRKAIPVEKVYSPRGYDTEDSAEVVIEGLLPNACHKSPKADIEVVGDTIEVNLTSLYYDPTNPFCAEIILPFIKTINLGLLKKGDYKVVVNQNTPYEEQAMFKVLNPSRTPGEGDMYANVEYIERRDDSRTIKLMGHNPSDCYVLKDIEVVSNKRSTYSVFPIMEKVSDFCPMKMTPFTYDVTIPNTINKPEVLIHVRTMNGDSINTILRNKFVMQ